MSRHRVTALALGVVVCAAACSAGDGTDAQSERTAASLPCVASTWVVSSCASSPGDAVAAATIDPTTSTSTPPAPTDPAPTAAPAPVDCTVSALLVPSCGAWLGASTAARSGRLTAADYMIGLGEYETVAQNTPDILHFYKAGAAEFPTDDEVAMANREGVPRSLLLYNWRPSDTLTWRQIADGGADRAIQSVAHGLMAYDHSLFLTIWHEPENEIGPVGSGNTPSDFAAMYRHVVTTLRSLGVSNAVFVMNYIGYPKWSNVVDRMYPGDDVVDWIGYDPYGFDENTDFASFLDTAKLPWPGFYTWATRKAPGKPIMLSEWGFDLTEANQAPLVLDGAPAIIRTRFPMLKALVYWNDNRGGSFAVRIDQTSALGTRYGRAYARLANDPYFNATSTDRAP